MPIRHRFSMVQPCTTVPWPIVTSSPIVVGCEPFMTCTMTPSCRFERRPTRMVCTSPRRTAHIQTLLLLADLDVADNLSAVVDVGRRMDAGHGPAVRAEHWKNYSGPSDRDDKGAARLGRKRPRVIEMPAIR